MYIYGVPGRTMQHFCVAGIALLASSLISPVLANLQQPYTMHRNKPKKHVIYLNKYVG